VAAHRYFKTTSVEIAEAALVDGCGPAGTLWRIIVPLALPAMAVVAFISYTLSWNEFLYAMFFIGSDWQKTSHLAGRPYHGDVFMWGQLMAAAVLGSMPAALIYAVSRWRVSRPVGGQCEGSSLALGKQFDGFCLPFRPPAAIDAADGSSATTCVSGGRR